MPAEQQFVVGQLYNGGLVNGLPFWTQPGGIGTQVFPEQPRQFPLQFEGYYQVPMTYPSLYVAGCLHAFNCYSIYKVYDPVNDIQVALIACPACSYIQQILPWDDYINYEITPIVVA
jgi:hypothetical protein